MKSPKELYYENLERIDNAINKGKGNPYRDTDGRFASGPSGGYKDDLSKALKKKSKGKDGTMNKKFLPGSDPITKKSNMGKNKINVETPYGFPFSKKNVDGSQKFDFKVMNQKSQYGNWDEAEFLFKKESDATKAKEYLAKSKLSHWSGVVDGRAKGATKLEKKYDGWYSLSPGTWSPENNATMYAALDGVDLRK